MEKIYTIILVDDEDDVRGRLVSKISQNSNFKVLGSASNGYDALELIEKLSPDIVITDIKMPFINGIELTKIIRRDFPKIKIAFVSGYDEFEYAREAIELSVVSFLMKPVTVDDINEFLSKLKTKLDEEHSFLYDETKLQNLYDASKPILVENIFKSMLYQDKITDDTIKQFKFLDIFFTGNKFLLINLMFNSSDDIAAFEKKRIFLNNLIETSFNKYSFVKSMRLNKNTLILINASNLFIRDVESILYEIIIRMNEFSNIKLQVGVSDIFTDLKEFSYAFERASKALEATKYLNVGDIVLYKDICDKKKIDLSISKDQMRDIRYIFKHGSKKEREDLIKKLTTSTLIEQNSIINHQYYVANIISFIYDFALSLNIDISQIANENLMDTLMSFNDLKQILEYSEEIILKIRNYNKDNTKNKADDTLSQIIEYIDNNFEDPQINLESICDKFQISVSYMSMIFKKEKQTTFTKYLVALRMEKAMELLKYKTDKIIEISEQVGYNEVYYFSHSFKKYTGYSPKEYRNNEKN
ncbi:hypothetical protein CI105_05570 [Candidatus Izimaplasma bacterium ZiA1]|uniref:response regulator n=1 Tax=Candidatus Izimoplasma sp. ZiA1 TaxID=2024899 RepID=UPI000BAA606C|nr:hypothetical protein CI105_05570 [Candidatus Izimaplasma bacterium ZiA1]